MKKWLLYLFIASQLLLFYFGLSTTKEALTLSSFYSGYPMHLAAFFVTGILLYLVLKDNGQGQKEITVIAYAAIAGALLELLQYFTGRELSYVDFLVDIGGAIISLAFIKLTMMLTKFFARKDDNKEHSTEKDKDDSLYNAMIIALVVGIIIVIASLIIMRPSPEYFTELYYPSPDSLEKFIAPGVMDTFNITISNHENGSVTYEIYTFALITPGDIIADISNETVTIEKDGQQSIRIDYFVAGGFMKAKIETRLINKDQEIHFFVYNEKRYVQYPDFLASTSCLNQTNLTGDLVIRARGSYDPELKIFVNGTMFQTVPLNMTPKDITLPETKGFIDLVFDNDLYNKTAGIDRNIYIDSVKVGGINVSSIIDGGKDSLAYDCENLKSGHLYSNGAYRMWLG